jgi:hypothetical protein
MGAPEPGTPTAMARALTAPQSEQNGKALGQELTRAEFDKNRDEVWHSPALQGRPPEIPLAGISATTSMD